MKTLSHFSLLVFLAKLNQKTSDSSDTENSVGPSVGSMGFWSLGRSENWEWIYWAYIGLAILHCPLGFNISEGKTRTLRSGMTGPRSHTFMGRSTCLP